MKDVMTALVGAAGSTAGFGLAFVAGVTALHGLKKAPEKDQLNHFMKVSVIAFFVAMLSTGIAFLWLVVDALQNSAVGSLLIILYIASVATFVASIGTLIYALARVMWLLRGTDLFVVAAEAAVRLKAFLAQ